MALSDDASNRAACELIAEALRGGDTVTIRAIGTSMLPAIWPGDLLTIQPATTMPAIGDVALVASPGGFRAHRVVACLMHGATVAVVTQGDALEAADPIVGHAEILGTVVCRNGKPLQRDTRSLQRTLGRFVTRCEPLRFLALRFRRVCRGRVYTHGRLENRAA